MRGRNYYARQRWRHCFHFDSLAYDFAWRRHCAILLYELKRSNEWNFQWNFQFKEILVFKNWLISGWQNANEPIFFNILKFLSKVHRTHICNESKYSCRILSILRINLFVAQSETETLILMRQENTTLQPYYYPARHNREPRTFWGVGKGNYLSLYLSKRQVSFTLSTEFTRCLTQPYTWKTNGELKECSSLLLQGNRHIMCVQ